MSERKLALPRIDTQYIEGRIEKLFKKVEEYNELELTSDDILKLFVKPQHRELVKIVARELGLRHSCTFSHKIHDLDVVFVVRDDSWVHPKYMGKVMFPDDAPEAAAKIDQWVLRRIEIGTEFGTLTGVFRKLNELCDSPKVLRYLWPTLLGVCRPELANRVRDMNPPKELPAISPGMLEAIKATELTVAKAMMMMPPPKNEDRSRPVLVYTNSSKKMHTAFGVAWTL